MKIKVSEATGHALNWMVEKAQGYGDQYLKFWNMGGDKRFTHCEVMRNYSTDWSQGGPIIEREHICINPNHAVWHAVMRHAARPNTNATIYSGPTPLVAAMRCFVASKLGDEVDVPALTFKGELITLPEMPEPFYWQVNRIDIDLRRQPDGYLEAWTGRYNGRDIDAVVSRAGTMYTAAYRMPTWQAALDYLAMRALLGGVDDGEKGDV